MQCRGSPLAGTAPGDKNCEQRILWTLTTQQLKASITSTAHRIANNDY
jgi:hypothetical protein